MPRTISSDQVMALVLKAQGALHANQEQLAHVMGSSLRTVQRWYARQGTPYDQDVTRLVFAVHPKDAALASKLAAAVGHTLESLGVVAPPAPPPAPEPAETGRAAPPPEHRELLVESVVAAAAEALDAPPRVARPAVLAALQRAKIAGLTVDDLLAVLHPATPQGA